MNSINFVVLGDSSIAVQLGKKGTATDIVIYDRKTADTVYTWTAPTTFPDKIQSLMQAVNIAEYAILNVAKLDKFLGEQIMALDSVGLADGFVFHSYEVDREKLKMLLKGTTLANYQFVDSVDQLKQEMAKLKPKKNADGPLTIPIDHAFDVKGVGTVALGVVKQGTIKVYDELVLLPGKKNVFVKSIQMHDDPVESSSSPARVGLAIKGVSVDDISRGDVICAPDDAVKVSSGAIAVKFAKSPFFKGDLPENHTYMVSVGMQVKAAKVKFEGETLQVTPEKPIVYKQGQTLVLLKPDSQGTRIAGKGSIR
ncbi:putative translation elongation factor EF Tu-like protein [Candidatus Nitrososphaera gargensis Ga9.2]|uniref:Putative translation elongation factor EF Tu-like protein n=1 Tax=Nitrososphaera gargensis (strain Ga9.2) TaxID=1237085 RepID=K0IH92_NITGG|nr:EF-Tu/IF-2/RF-3 family GTPase [Candidatus Nitrososphaera gargensis]AFU59270.1 putative translation elongation factor EF Tu-like protein [Candidatus Nitrososphaera gargensis Ga9.2]